MAPRDDGANRTKRVVLALTQQPAVLGRQRIVEQRRAIRLIDRRLVNHRHPESLDLARFNTFADEDDARRPIRVGPCGQSARRMKDALDALNDQRLAGIVSERDQAFDAQQARGEARADEIDELRAVAPFDRRRPAQTMRADRWTMRRLLGEEAPAGGPTDRICAVGVAIGRPSLEKICD